MMSEAAVGQAMLALRYEIEYVDAHLDRLGRQRAALLRCLDELETIATSDTPMAGDAGNPQRSEPSIQQANSSPATPRPGTPRPAGEPVVCPDCGDTFRSAAGLGSHRHQRHNRPAPVLALHAPPGPEPHLGRCSCGRDIPDADTWGQHNRTITNPADHTLIRTGQPA
jgi:hypothetical protein